MFIISIFQFINISAKFCAIWSEQLGLAYEVIGGSLESVYYIQKLNHDDNVPEPAHERADYAMPLIHVYLEFNHLIVYLNSVCWFLFLTGDRIILMNTFLLLLNFFERMLSFLGECREMLQMKINNLMALFDVPGAHVFNLAFVLF